MPAELNLLHGDPVATAHRGVYGGPTYAYRGAIIESNAEGTLFSLC
jgi:hypothetical protein